MGDNEIDQATVDVVKTILESKNGKAWFAEYLKNNLRLQLHSGSHSAGIHLTFNGELISFVDLRFSTTIN